MLVGIIGFVGMIIVGLFVREKFLDILEKFLDK